MTNEVKKDVELTNEERQPCVCFTEKRAAEHDCKCRKAE